MAKSGKQKMKILLIMKELWEKTDEENPISTTELIQMLEQNGIEAGRKSVYDDIETLRNFGLDIEWSRESPKGYYVASRDFELAELNRIFQSSGFTDTLHNL